MKNNLYKYTKIRENIWQIVEDNITTPYVVINSHGHPDHIGGNHWFDRVYSSKKEWDVIKHFEENEPKLYEMKDYGYLITGLYQWQTYIKR